MNIYIDPRYKYLLADIHEISLPVPEIVGKFLSLLFETPPPPPLLFQNILVAPIVDP